MIILFFGLGFRVKCIRDNGYQTKLMQNKLDYMSSKRCLVGYLSLENHFVYGLRHKSCSRRLVNSCCACSHDLSHNFWNSCGIFCGSKFEDSHTHFVVI